MGDFIVGLDIGNRLDYTALAVLEMQGADRPHYTVRHLERVRDLEYRQQALWLKDRLSRPPLAPGLLARVGQAVGHDITAPNVHVVMDETGVGVAVAEIFRSVGIPHDITGVMITAGTATTQVSPRRWHVAKCHLVSTVDALLDTQRLTVGRQVRERETLISELHGFRRKFTAAANEVYGNGREAPHDDLVLAVALAAWAGEHGPGRPAHVWWLGGPLREHEREVPINEVDWDHALGRY